MSSKASLRTIGRQEEKKGFRQIRKGFMGELNILKSSKQKYFYIQFNRIIKIAESGVLGITKEDLKALMKDYIDTDKKPEVN